jgi:UDP-N-acetylmuramate dehydrogenase
MSMPSLETYAEIAPMRRDEPLSRWTTLRIGGSAEMFFEPHRPENLADLLTALEKDGVPWRLLGAGANTLAPDGGVDGAVIHTGNMRRCFRDGSGLRAWCGVNLPALVRNAQGVGLSGFESLVGVPGHVGGALAMNAGSAEWGIWDQVENVVLWMPGEREGLKIEEHLPAEIGPKYRDGHLQGAVVLEVLFHLEEQPAKVVKERQDEILRRKNRSQPVSLSSAGCAFKNPPGDSAGRLVDAAGMKGFQVGGAQVSELHANFILNLGSATAADVRDLLTTVEEKVEAESGIRLQRELVVWPEPIAPC